MRQDPPPQNFAPTQSLGPALEERLPGTPLDQVVELKDRLLRALSDQRPAIVQGERSFIYEVLTAPDGVHFSNSPTGEQFRPGSGAYQIAARIVKDNGNVALYLATPGSSNYRRFDFRFDVDLYGLHLYSTDVMALFESRDSTGRQILRIAPQADQGAILVWRYYVEELSAAQSESRVDSIAGDSAGYHRRTLRVTQQALAIPTSADREQPTTDRMDRPAAGPSEAAPRSEPLRRQRFAPHTAEGQDQDQEEEANSFSSGDGDDN